MDDRDYVDEYDRPARHIWKSREYQHDYWVLRAKELHEAEGPVMVADKTADFTMPTGHGARKCWARQKVP